MSTRSAEHEFSVDVVDKASPVISIGSKDAGKFVNIARSTLVFCGNQRDLVYGRDVDTFFSHLSSGPGSVLENITSLGFYLQTEQKF